MNPPSRDNSTVYIVYGISDCPACLRACADLMEADHQYVFVEADFSVSYRNRLKRKMNWHTFPIIVRCDADHEELVGGYEELCALLAKDARSPD
jgi:glutaredoxin-related protein